MSKFRTSGHDIAPKIKPAMPPKIGEPPPGRLGIFKADGKTRVGHIGPKAGAGAVSRFIGHTNVKVTQINGRPAWQEIGLTSGRGAAKAAAVANAKLEKSLRSESGLNELLHTLAPLKVQTVYLDTWARMLQASGGHDSDPKIVSQALRGCDLIREQLGCAVNVAAHVGLKEQWRLKGMSEFEGMIDGATRCEKIGDGPGAVYTFESVFQRHAEDGFKLTATLEKAGPSAYLVNTAPADVKRNKLKEDDAKCYDILVGLIKSNTEDVIDGIPIAAWRDAVKAAGMWSDAANWRSAWQRSKDAIVEAGLIEIASNQVYLKAQ